MIPHAWSFEVTADTQAWVMPDGCRDVLLVSNLNRGQTSHYTEVDVQPRRVLLAAGTRIRGYRLRPGVSIPWRDLREDLVSTSDPAALVAEAAAEEQESALAIEWLAEPGASLRGVARQLGVSERTLQRKFSASGLPAPDFWRRLARARRATRLLSGLAPLAAIALKVGYSDQAHMTRELTRWFGASPLRLRRAPSILAETLHSGLGNWTGEQISIK